MAAQLRTPELLAPAGDRECLHAAVTAGADAVYLGLEEFNARRNASNFSLEELAEACAYAHVRGVHVYVTMNTMILPHELDRAIELATAAYEAGADAFIIQDPGLADSLGRLVPPLPVHLSTQMNIHNEAGVGLAAMLGARRITLARELSLEEIARISALAEELGMQTECFIHGALCFCYSGQCLLSSMVGGRSANRGLCAQPCRLPYELHREDREGSLEVPGEHLLSPKDLCTIDIVDDLVAAGVSSLKIEGRMKSPEYVFAAVSAYRAAIDKATDLEPKRKQLEEAFSRGFTTAYIEGERGNGMMGYGRPNNRGVFVGRVTRVDDGMAHVRCEKPLNEGDVLEFWTNRGNFTAPVGSSCKAQESIAIAVEGNPSKGDRVFRVRNSSLAFDDKPFEPRIPVRGEVTLKIGQPAEVRFMAPDGTSATARGDSVEAARTRALAVEDVREHIGRMGQTDFILDRPDDLTVDLDQGVGMGFSSIHHLRDEALKALAGRLRENTEKGRRVSVPSRAYLHDQVREIPLDPRIEDQPLQVCALVTNPPCARAVKKAGAADIYVPLLNFKRGQAQIAGVLQDGAEQAGYPKQCIMMLPAIDRTSDLLGDEGKPFDMWEYVHAGKRVLVDNLGDAWEALQLGAQVEVGPHVLITNRASLALMAAMGVSRVWLSPELNLGQIAELASHSPVELGLFISGAQELMVSEHCVLMAQGPCAQDCQGCERRKVRSSLKDRKGFDFPVITDMYGRSHIYNGVEFDGVPTIPDLAAMGVRSFMVDTTLLEKDEAAMALRRALRSASSMSGEAGVPDKRKGATTGHLFRGVA